MFWRRPLWIVTILLWAAADARADQLPGLGGDLTDSQVALFAELALKNIATEFPNKPSNVMKGPESVQSPKQMHPAFYGCFDWHSSVHGHWMLVRLLVLHPDHALAPRIREQLNQHLTAELIETEADYFRQDENKGFERMYGWAWALRLVAELHAWNDADGRRWRDNLRSLETVLVARTKSYLPLLTHPIRIGEHFDTGFALAQILDYARVVGDNDLETLIVQRGRAFYLNDRDFPFRYEPSGQDFFSSGLNEADFMRRVTTQQEFVDWLGRFLPRDLSDAEQFVRPVQVSDVTDDKLVHLAGLNLSRAWCMQGVASALPTADPRKAVLLASAQQHAEIGLRYVFSGHYSGEHWLATFAIYALKPPG